MLENTFCHIPGISGATEKLLWSAGIHSWGAFLRKAESIFPPRRTEGVIDCINDSLAHLQRGDPLYFSGHLPSREQWRLFSNFRHTVAYLDIETTGLTRSEDVITTIALYDGRNVRYYVQGENLHEFARDVEQYHLLVTYNGTRFDIPFIESSFGISLRRAHIDLMYLLRSLGYRGGLKGCERQLGLSRGDLEGVDGWFAVLLWREFCRSGDRAALETLLAYNIEDVVNLETLMVMAFNMKVKETPFSGSHQLPLPERPSIPFRPHRETVDRIRRHWCHPQW